MKLEQIISHTLRWGVASSLLLLAGGMLLSFAYGVPEEFTNTPPSLPLLLAGLVQGSAPAWIFAGLLLLILTPVFRVIVSLAAFLRQKDWIYTAICAAILALLATAFFLGMR